MPAAVRYFFKINAIVWAVKRLSLKLHPLLNFLNIGPDLISLLGRTKKLISCHGSVTHAANSFNIMKIDILEKNKVSFYQRFSSYLKEYKPIFREDFKTLKESIYIKLNI